MPSTTSACRRAATAAVEAAALLGEVVALVEVEVVLVDAVVEVVVLAEVDVVLVDALVEVVVLAEVEVVLVGALVEVVVLAPQPRRVR